jgi:predicted DNA-binding transcriptional regulator AlpA
MFYAVSAAGGGSGDGCPPDGPKRTGAMRLPHFCACACVSRSYAYSEITAGRLRVTKLGRSTRILVEDAEAWLKSRPTYKPKGNGRKKPTPEAGRDKEGAE